MKYAKANTVRTQQNIALYGKRARHPLCQAALTLWGADAAFSTLERDIGEVEKTVNSAKQQKREAGAFYKQFCKEGKEKDAIQAAVLVRKIGDFLTKMQPHYEAGVKLRSMLRESRLVLVAPFKREYDAAIRSGNVQALRALPRVQKRWNDKKVCLGDSDRRTLEILNMHRDKVTKAAWATGGACAGYLEAGLGGTRALSDEVWQGRLTVREIRSRLMTAGGASLAGDKDGKEIRRTMKRLGIRPAQDQRGRKWKPPLPKKQEPKRRPSGRPRTKPDTTFTDHLEVVEVEVEKGKGDKTVEHEESLSWKMRNQQELAWARQVLKSIDREINRLLLRRGGRKGQFVY